MQINLGLISYNFVENFNSLIMDLKQDINLKAILKIKQFHGKGIYINIIFLSDYIQTKPNHDPNFDYNYWVYLKMQPTESSNDLPDIIICVRYYLY